MRQHRTALSLRARLVTAVALLLSCFALFVLWLLPSLLDTVSKRWVERRSMAIASVLGRAVEPAFDFGDRKSAERHLAQLAAIPEARYATVAKDDGSVLATWSPSGANTSIASLADGVTFTGDQAQVTLRLHTRGGQHGALVIGFSLTEMARESQRGLRLAIAVSLAIVLLGILAAFVAGTYLVRPLRRVTEAALLIARGHDAAHVQLDTTSDDEPGRLAKAMRLMLDRLREERDRVESLNHSLESRVQARTQELAAANEELARRLAELKTTQEQLVLADRLRSVAMLASGVAHEINNPLAYMVANVGFVREALDREKRNQGDEAKLGGVAYSEVNAALADAAQGCERVRQIVQSLRIFSRAEDNQREPTQVEEAVEYALGVTAGQIRHCARLVRQYSKVPPVLASRVRLGQVFLNLLVNAVQAIEARGGDAQQHAIVVTIGQARDGRVCVTISDTGTGMSENVRLRLFTPFFTTKPVGVGTGLGLSISHGIVTALSGEIAVATAPGLGSTFTVLLPPTQGALPAVAAPTCTRQAPSRASLLVIDDDPRVGSALVRSLRATYEVEAITSADQGLARLGQTKEYDLVLCDLMMPDMNGMEFFGHVQKLYPLYQDRIVFFTGGAFNDVVARFAEEHADRCLTKPLDMDQLHRVIEHRRGTVGERGASHVGCQAPSTPER